MRLAKLDIALDKEVKTVSRERANGRKVERRSAKEMHQRKLILQR